MRTDDLLALAKVYAQSQGIALGTVGLRAVNNERIFRRMAKGAGCNSRSGDLAAAWFREHWPKDIPWAAKEPRWCFWDYLT